MLYLFVVFKTNDEENTYINDHILYKVQLGAFSYAANAYELSEGKLDKAYDTEYNINDTVIISEDDRECLAYIISGEAWGEPIEGKMAVAQCLLNAMRQDGLSAEEVKVKYQYAGWKTDLDEIDPENWEQVLESIERVFDKGETVTDENILWFYAPKYCTSKWHETQKYVGTFGSQRFFAPND